MINISSSKIKVKLAPQEDWKDKYLRSVAELDNFRKRTALEKVQTATNMKAEIIEQFLPVADSIISAMKMNVEGIEPLYSQLNDVFAKLGVTEIEAVGCEFNPNLHNAIMHEEDKAKGKNLIAEEFSKGYKLGDRVIRHSLVKVVN